MRPLTIAIPTHNRAALLRAQLEWLTAAVRGHEDLCDVLVSDNASTDDTPAVIDRWRRTHPQAVRHVRQPHDLGAVGNVMWCTREAASRHVWVIGDDDHVDEGAIGFVLQHLAGSPDLGVLVLNFSARSAVTGEEVFPRCFDVEGAGVASGGIPLYERLLDHPDLSRWGGLMFTSALVVRSDLARAALSGWPAASTNFAGQLYLSAYCAAHGGMDVTAATWLENATGTHYFMGDPANQARYWLGEIPTAMAALATLGYSREVLRRRVLAQLRGFGGAAVKTAPRWPVRNTRAVLGCAAALVALSRPRRSGARRAVGTGQGGERGRGGP